MLNKCIIQWFWVDVTTKAQNSLSINSTCWGWGCWMDILSLVATAVHLFCVFRPAFGSYALMCRCCPGWWNDAALSAHCRILENGHIRHPGADMLTYPSTVVSHDGRLMYAWTAVSNSGRRRLSRNTTFRECISRLKSLKNVWKWTCFFQFLSTPQSWLTYKSWSTPWGGTQKRLKTAKKIVRPALGCAQHPKASQNTQHICKKDLKTFHEWLQFVIFLQLYL